MINFQIAQREARSMTLQEREKEVEKDEPSQQHFPGFFLLLQPYILPTQWCRLLVVVGCCCLFLLL